MTLGDFRDYHIWLALVGLVVTGSLLFHQVGGWVVTLPMEPTRFLLLLLAGPLTDSNSPTTSTDLLLPR